MSTGWKSLDRFINESSNMTLSVGFFAEDKYENDEGVEIPVPAVAYMQEFGGSGIPKRPFMRPTIEEKSQQWANTMASSIHQNFNSTDVIKTAFQAVGKEAVKDVKDKIKSIHTPPLAPLTLANRREKGNYSIKPLIDTHKMINSVKYKIDG